MRPASFIASYLYTRVSSLHFHCQYADAQVSHDYQLQDIFARGHCISFVFTALDILDSRYRYWTRRQVSQSIIDVSEIQRRRPYRDEQIDYAGTTPRPFSRQYYATPAKYLLAAAADSHFAIEVSEYLQASHAEDSLRPSFSWAPVATAPRCAFAPPRFSFRRVFSRASSAPRRFRHCIIFWAISAGHWRRGWLRCWQSAFRRSQPTDIELFSRRHADYAITGWEPQADTLSLHYSWDYGFGLADISAAATEEMSQSQKTGLSEREIWAFLDIFLYFHWFVSRYQPLDVETWLHRATTETVIAFDSWLHLGTAIYWD